MMMRIPGILLMLAALLWSWGFVPSVLAQASEEPSDYAGFNRFPGSQITNYRHSESTVYRLPLGRMQRVDGQVAPGRSRRMTGELYRITYEIPAGFTAEDAFEHFSGQLLESEEAALFECSGRGCGSSNYWANDMFDNRVLYGPVEGQFYMAAAYRSMDDGRPVRGYAALYTVTRGNRRVYAHLDFLEVPESEIGSLMVTPDAIRLQLQQSGAAIIPRLAFDEQDSLVDDGGIELIMETLQRDSLLEVMIVSHLWESGSGTADLQRRSEQRAELIRQRLLSEGVGEDRVTAHGAGPLAPWCPAGPCYERVELVRQP